MPDRLVIPGLAEAIARETELRNQAFLDIPQELCGIPVLPLTLRRLLLLEEIGSPFVGGSTRAPRPRDVVNFLWALSPYFSTRPGDLRRFSKRCRKLNPARIVLAIDGYVCDALQDRPPSTSGPTAPSYESFAAGYVDVIASEYGWSEDAILDCPVARLFQYLKRILRRKDPKAPRFNPSDQVKADYLNELNAEAQQQREALN